MGGAGVDEGCPILALNLDVAEAVPHPFGCPGLADCVHCRPDVHRGGPAAPGLDYQLPESHCGQRLHEWRLHHHCPLTGGLVGCGLGQEGWLFALFFLPWQ